MEKPKSITLQELKGKCRFQKRVEIILQPVVMREDGDFQRRYLVIIRCEDDYGQPETRQLFIDGKAKSFASVDSAITWADCIGAHFLSLHAPLGE